MGRRHFNCTARHLGYGENPERLLQEIIERMPRVIGEVQQQLPEGFSQEAAVKVFGGLAAAARVLEGMPTN